MALALIGVQVSLQMRSWTKQSCRARCIVTAHHLLSNTLPPFRDRTITIIPPHPLPSQPRPFVYDTVTLADAIEIDPDDPASLEAFLAGRVNDLVLKGEALAREREGEDGKPMLVRDLRAEMSEGEGCRSPTAPPLVPRPPHPSPPPPPSLSPLHPSHPLTPPTPLTPSPPLNPPYKSQPLVRLCVDYTCFSTIDMYDYNY